MLSLSSRAHSTGSIQETRRQCVLVWYGEASDGDSSKNTAFSVGVVWKEEGCCFLWQEIKPRLTSPWSLVDSDFPLCLFTGQMTNWWHFSPDTEIWISWSHTAGTMQGSISSIVVRSGNENLSDHFGLPSKQFGAARRKLRVGERQPRWDLKLLLWCHWKAEIIINVSPQVLALYTFCQALLCIQCLIVAISRWIERPCSFPLYWWEAWGPQLVMSPTIWSASHSTNISLMPSVCQAGSFLAVNKTKSLFSREFTL